MVHSRRLKYAMILRETSVFVTEKILRTLDRCPVSGFGPPSADLDPPTKLSENIILNVLVKMDDTLRSSAY